MITGGTKLKKIVLMLCALLMLPLFTQPISASQMDMYLDIPSREVSAAVPDLAPNATSAILMDADSGTILFEKNSHAALPPASITKIMTMLLVVEAIDSNKLAMTDLVRTSENAAKMGGSQIFLEVGEEMTVEEMLKGVAMASGNDASVALAEKIAGTEAAFVELMNKRAKELGMENTNFMNSNGLPEANHYSSAYDIALVSRELMKHETILKFTGKYQDYLRKNSEKPFWLVNTNKLVRFYPGADGIKTGYTSEAKFCLSATAARDGMRVIAVIMGAPSTKVRNAEVSQMLDFAFNTYKSFVVVPENTELGTLNIERGKESKVTIVTTVPISVVLPRGTVESDIHYEVDMDDTIHAPVAEKQPIGKLIVYHKDSIIKEYEIVSPQSIQKSNWFDLLKRSTKSLFN